MDFNFENELKDRIALVTGGSKGAGKAIADRLLKAGATVIITARNKPEDESNHVHFIAADLSKPNGTRKVVNEVLEKFGHLDILINNMGGSETPGGGFAVLSDSDWENELDSTAFANYFTEHATVSDEGSSYSGREEIKQWIQAATEKYNMQLTPIDFTQTGSKGKLSNWGWDLLKFFPTAIPPPASYRDAPGPVRESPATTV